MSGSEEKAYHYSYSQYRKIWTNYRRRIKSMFRRHSGILNPHSVLLFLLSIPFIIFPFSVFTETSATLLLCQTHTGWSPSWLDSETQHLLSLHSHWSLHFWDSEAWVRYILISSVWSLSLRASSRFISQVSREISDQLSKRLVLEA